MINNTLFRFLLVGCANFATGYSIILFLYYVIGASALSSNAGGYAAGFLLSYGLNRNFTFGSKKPHTKTLPRFLLAASLSFIINLVVLKISLLVFAFSVALAQVLAISAYTLTFYFISRFIVFRKDEREQPN